MKQSLSTQEKRAKADEIVNLIDNLVSAIIDQQRPVRWTPDNEVKSARVILRKSLMEIL